MKHKNTQKNYPKKRKKEKIVTSDSDETDDEPAD